MNRRTVLKGGLSVATSAPRVVLAPLVTMEPPGEDPREVIKRLSLRISALMNEVEEYDMVSIRPAARQEKAVHTY